MNEIISQRDNHAADSATGDHSVACFQLSKHLLPFLLPALLGKNEQKIEDGKDQNQGGDAAQDSKTSAGLECESENSRMVHCRTYRTVQSSTSRGRFPPPELLVSSLPLGNSVNQLNGPDLSLSTGNRGNKIREPANCRPASKWLVMHVNA